MKEHGKTTLGTLLQDIPVDKKIVREEITNLAAQLRKNRNALESAPTTRGLINASGSFYPMTKKSLVNTALLSFHPTTIGTIRKAVVRICTDYSHENPEAEKILKQKANILRDMVEHKL